MPNNKQTTAVSQLIEIYKKGKRNVVGELNLKLIDGVIDDLTRILPIVNNQIKKAHTDGYSKCANEYFHNEFQDNAKSDDYFTSTFITD